MDHLIMSTFSQVYETYNFYILFKMCTHYYLFKVKHCLENDKHLTKRLKLDGNQYICNIDSYPIHKVHVWYTPQNVDTVGRSLSYTLQIMYNPLSELYIHMSLSQALLISEK